MGHLYGLLPKVKYEFINLFFFEVDNDTLSKTVTVFFFLF